MTVLPDEGRADGANGLFLVVSHTDNQYLVDVVSGACECADAEYRDPDSGCKHVRRAEYATGERAIPQWVDADAVDDCLGTATDDGPRYAVADGGIIEADDDEVIGETDTDDGGRSDDCNCLASFEDLPCFSCWLAGFRTPADTDE